MNKAANFPGGRGNVCAVRGRLFSRMLIFPATRVLGSRCLDLGTVGEGQGRLTGGNGAVRWQGGGMAWGRETQ
jgi:hypothetical protein